MKHIPMRQITTPRLLLREVRMSDLEHYHARLTSDPLVAKHMLWSANPDIAHTRSTIARIQKGYADGTRYHWGIALRETDALIGTIALLGFDEADNSCTFAFMLGRDFWGKGYASEALRAVLGFAFGVLQVSLVVADHFEENTASGAAMKKAGMTKSGYLTSRYHKDGKAINSVQYSIHNRAFFQKAEP